MFEPFNDNVFQTEKLDSLSLNMIENTTDTPSSCIDPDDYGIKRRKTTEVNVGNVVIGGNSPISCLLYTSDAADE